MGRVVGIMSLLVGILTRSRKLDSALCPSTSCTALLGLSTSMLFVEEACETSASVAVLKYGCTSELARMSRDCQVHTAVREIDGVVGSMIWAD